MSRQKKARLKDAKAARGGAGHFLPVPLVVLQSTALAKLSPHAAKLLWDIMSQYQYGWNGDASAAFENVLRARGWRSKATLYKALKELLASGLIVLTRQGSLHRCSLYGLGWIAIDDCGGKLEVGPTGIPIGGWDSKPFRPEKTKSPSTKRVPKPKKKGD